MTVPRSGDSATTFVIALLEGQFQILGHFFGQLLAAELGLGRQPGAVHFGFFLLRIVAKRDER